MSGGGSSLSIDDREVRLTQELDGTIRVVVGGQFVGTLERMRGSSHYVALRPGGEPVRRPSPWGGEATARFGSQELAVRALVEP